MTSLGVRKDGLLRQPLLDEDVGGEVGRHVSELHDDPLFQPGERLDQLPLEVWRDV